MAVDALVGALLGAVVGALVVSACWWRRLRSLRNDPAWLSSTEPGWSDAAGSARDRQVATRELASQSIDRLRAGVLVLGPGDELLLANRAAHELGLLEGDRLRHTALRGAVRQLRVDTHGGGPVERDVELDLPGGVGRANLGARVRTAALDTPGHVVLQVEDISQVHRVARLRRDFVTNVSHELKTPVGALQLLAEAVEEAADDPETVQRFARRVRTESHRLGMMVNEVLELSRLQSGEEPVVLRPVNTSALLADALDRASTAARAKNISLTIGGDVAVSALGDYRQLLMALSNLVANAVTYSPAHTRVTLSAHRDEAGVRLCVTDQGMGIPAGDFERIFERFYRADPARSRATGGTGLGLAIVKHVATGHAGRVEVWSKPGEGSTFTIHLQAGPTAVAGPWAPEDDEASVRDPGCSEAGPSTAKGSA